MPKHQEVLRSHLEEDASIRAGIEDAPQGHLVGLCFRDKEQATHPAIKCKMVDIMQPKSNGSMYGDPVFNNIIARAIHRKPRIGF